MGILSATTEPLVDLKFLCRNSKIKTIALVIYYFFQEKLDVKKNNGSR